MLVLVVGDIHGGVANLEKIIKLIHNKGVELVLLFGDLTNLGDAKEAEEALRALKGFAVLAIAGNLDTLDVANFLEERGISLQGKKKGFGKFTLVGFGGGLIGNVGGFLFSEGQIKEGLLKLVEGEKNLVLLTHLPPFGTKIDLSSRGIHIGSRAVKEIIEKKQPVLHLCGHAHGAFGEISIGKTVCINVGAVKEGRALLLHLGDELKWERIQV